MLEIWKKVDCFPQYQVSNLGRVKSFTSHSKGKLVAWGFRGRRVQYPTVGLYVSSKKRVRIFVHLLVLRTFVGPCPVDQEARHLDGNPLNPVLSNLKYGTKLENWEDRRQHGRGMEGEHNVKAKLTLEQVKMLRDRKWVRGEQKMWASKLGVSRGTIRKAVIGESWV